jgi:hypothetical protein
MNGAGICGAASSFASSLAAEREGERAQEKEEVGATFIGAEGWHIWQGINGIEGGEGIAHSEVTAKTFGQRLRMLRWPDSWVLLVSEGERRNAYRFRGKEKMGRRPFSGLGQKVSPEPCSIFFLFCFSISSITSSNLVQIDSNQFLKKFENSRQQVWTVRNMVS